MAGELIVVRVEGLAELSAKLTQLPEDLENKVMREAMRNGGAIIETEAKVLARHRTGKLAESIQTTVKASAYNGEFEADIAAKDPKAHLLEFGTAPHVEEAGRHGAHETGKKVMADVAGGVVFGRSVKHPGSPAFPFMRPAFDTKAQDALEAIRSTIAGYLEKQTVPAA